eukprot:6193579-Pleurochrysis_carterae.AAC.3
MHCANERLLRTVEMTRCQLSALHCPPANNTLTAPRLHFSHRVTLRAQDAQHTPDDESEAVGVVPTPSPQSASLGDITVFCELRDGAVLYAGAQGGDTGDGGAACGGRGGGGDGGSRSPSALCSVSSRKALLLRASRTFVWTRPMRRAPPIFSPKTRPKRCAPRTA